MGPYRRCRADHLHELRQPSRCRPLHSLDPPAPGIFATADRHRVSAHTGIELSAAVAVAVFCRQAANNVTLRSYASVPMVKYGQLDRRSAMTIFRKPRRQSSSSPQNEAGHRSDPCAYYREKSFSNPKQKEIYRKRLFTITLSGSGCWMRMQACVCHYPDRNPLYSCGEGEPVEGSPERCEALRQARLKQLNKIRTLESRRLIRAYQNEVRKGFDKMKRWPAAFHIFFGSWHMSRLLKKLGKYPL